LDSSPTGVQVQDSSPTTLDLTHVVSNHDGLYCCECVKQVKDDKMQEVTDAQQEIDELIREGELMF